MPPQNDLTLFSISGLKLTRHRRLAHGSTQTGDQAEFKNLLSSLPPPSPAAVLPARIAPYRLDRVRIRGTTTIKITWKSHKRHVLFCPIHILLVLGLGGVIEGPRGVLGDGDHNINARIWVRIPPQIHADRWCLFPCIQLFNCTVYRISQHPQPWYYWRSLLRWVDDVG
ncbi:hypothetical protein DFH07DRAFT_773027 [Mycena maculata]|uniref:Uncharacterized protein n=1 Tax=Mycena maculata TaxID=230809 RepID=A0AAD7NE31_9AGAR|nr:hypothetical protein DFH07DRAFT_773027 [Mycena maculata]